MATPDVTPSANEGGLHRLLVRVPAGYVAQIRRMHTPRDPRASGYSGQKILVSDVKNRIARMGFEPPLLATQDPTDNSVFNVLARRNPNVPLTADPALKITGAVPVEEPPSTPKNNIPALDYGLGQDEAWMIKTALLYDRNPRHLNGVAAALEPWFPISAALLRAKASLIEKRVSMDATKSLALLRTAFQAAPDLPSIAQAKSAFESYAKQAALPFDVLRDNVKRAAVRFVNMTRPDVWTGEKKESLPAPIVNLARTTLLDTSSTANGSLRFINPHAMRLALPQDGNEGFVSPSAIQLTLGSQKPAWSGIQKQDQLAGVWKRIQPDTLMGMNFRDRMSVLKAQNQMERADKAIQRRRWVEWYRRNEPERANTITNAKLVPA